MAKEEKKVYRLDNSGIKEPEPKSAPEAGKIHVDLYLKALGVPLWERGGKRAFAIAKKLEFASEQEFVELFKAY